MGYTYTAGSRVLCLGSRSMARRKFNRWRMNVAAFAAAVLNATWWLLITSNIVFVSGCNQGCSTLVSHSAIVSRDLKSWLISGCTQKRETRNIFVGPHLVQWLLTTWKFLFGLLSTVFCAPELNYSHLNYLFGSLVMLTPISMNCIPLRGTTQWYNVLNVNVVEGLWTMHVKRTDGIQQESA